MNKPIKIKINVTRILKDQLYAGKNGKYLDLVAWPNKNGQPDQYGNTHFVCQDIPREARDAGVKGPILGNLRLPEYEESAQAQDAPKRKENAITEGARKWDEQREATKTLSVEKPLEEEDDLAF